MSSRLRIAASVNNHTGGTAFGLWLKQRRKALGLTQKELAERVECSTVTIEKIESGERKPSGQVAELLAAFLNVPADERRAFVEFARAPLSASQLAHLTRDDNRSPWRTLRALTTNLPAPPTAFIGRETEVRTARDLLQRPSVRLLTITGPPGIGKTRLSLQVAEESARDFEDGVTFVPLAPVLNPDLVASSIAGALGIRDTGGQPLPEGLKSHLKDRRALLVLDNFEQVIPAAPLVTDLLASAPWLKVLVTSREVLHVYGEHEFPVPPMTLLDSRYLPPVERLMQYEAVRLFVERATAVRPDFALTTENAPAVVEICVRLDRMPLAIELAAARARTLTPEQIVGRLDSSLELLSGGARDLPLRQRALRSAIDWSYDLLNDGERALFRRISIFVGGCTLEAIEAVCNPGVGNRESGVGGKEPIPDSRFLTPLQIDVSDGVASLVDKSLVRQEEIQGEIRFSMLETIREYAWWRLVGRGEDGAMRERHAAYFLDMAEEAKSLLKGSGQLAWLDRLEQEHDNLRAVLRWSLERGDAETALRLGGALWRFWLTHGHLTEGRRWLTSALELGGEVAPGLRYGPIGANALNGAGNLACACGDFVSAQPLYEESLDIRRKLGDKPGIASSLNNLALVAHTQCDYPRVRAFHEESLAIKRELGDRWGIASSLGNLGMVATDQGDYAGAVALHEESLAMRRELGDKLGVGLSLLNLGVAKFIGGDHAAAQALYEESLAIRKELGDRPGIAECLVKQAEVAHCQGNYAKAAYLAQQSLDICRELGDKPGIANALLDLGHAAHRQGMSASGGPRRAAALFKESLAIRRDLYDKRGTVECLSALASVAVSLRQVEKAGKLFGVVDGLLLALGFHLHPVDHMEYERGRTAVRDLLTEEVFQNAWKNGQSVPVEQAITFALEEA